MGDNRRESERYEVGGTKAVMDCLDFRVVNISAHGALLEGVSEDIHLGDRVKFVMYVPITGAILPVETEGEVVRYVRNRFAVHYHTPRNVWPKLLSLLAETDKRMHPEPRSGS